MRLLLLLLAAAAHAATLSGRVVDAETGAVIPATVSIGGVSFLTAGEFERSLPQSVTTVRVSRGFDYIPVERRYTLAADERRTETFTLRRRSPLRREGWYAGDNHDHVIHGERAILVDFPHVALAARAEGLDYLAVAQDWNLVPATPEALDRVTRAQSRPDFLLTWNLEAPKNYWRGDASHTIGHGWTAGMRGRTADGRDAVAELLALSAMDYESGKPPVPNFEIQALIHSLGGISAYSHPARWWRGKWGGVGPYPVEENKFISNMAAELPFDTISGPTYDAIDILMPPEEVRANQEALKLWYLLLDRGYHIAASGSTDATFDRPGGGVPGRVRMYTRLAAPLDMQLDMQKVALAIRDAHSFITSGPLLALDIGGHPSGDTITLPSGAQKGSIRAWADGLKRIEMIRNGAVWRTFEVPAGQAEFRVTFDVAETTRAWYVARAYGADATQVAFANPIWFEPAGWRPPAPTPAHVEATVTGLNGEPLDGECEVLRMVGREQVVESHLPFRGGRFTADVPGTARLRVHSIGYPPLTKSIFMDYAPLRDLTLNLTPEQLTDWRTFEANRRALGQVRLEFRLER